MLTLLTAAIGIVAKGRAAKAIAGAILPTIAGAIAGPEMLSQFQSGFGEAMGPTAYAFGMAIGGLVSGGLNYAITWLAPANKN